MIDAATAARRAFTILEVIVTVVIIAVLASALLPRLMAMGGRETRASALAVGDLISTAARRDSLTSQRVALSFDAERTRLALTTLVTPEGQVNVGEWREDRLIPAVDLGDTRLVDALADGVPLDAKGWRLEFPQGGRRPALELVLSDAKNKEFWKVELPSSASHALVSPGTAQGLTDQSIDLDASGGGTSPW